MSFADINLGPHPGEYAYAALTSEALPPFIIIHYRYLNSIFNVSAIGEYH
jgi:hypothetical protein